MGLPGTLACRQLLLDYSDHIMQVNLYTHKHTHCSIRLKNSDTYILVIGFYPLLLSNERDKMQAKEYNNDDPEITSNPE